MTTTEKHRAKKLARIYSILTWSMMIYFFIQSAVTIIIRYFSVGQWNLTPVLILMLALILPLILALIFNLKSQLQLNKLKRYKANIIEYRTRKYFLQCLNEILTGNLKEALEIYNNFISEGHELRGYLFSLLMFEMSKSTDPELKKIGDVKISMFIDAFNPDVVLK